MIDLKSQREAATKAAQDVADSTKEFATKTKDFGVSTAKTISENATDYFDKAKEYGGTAADSATDTAKSMFDKVQSLTEDYLEKLGDLQIGEKNVGEIVEATVDTVEEKIDVDQIQDQVAKLRDQMENVLVSWKDSFRPSQKTTEEPVKKAPTMSRKQLNAMTKDELLAIARERDLAGRSSMTKSELIKNLAA